jgi:hypothetical protein
MVIQKSGDQYYGTNSNLTVSPLGSVYIRFNINSTLPEATTGIGRLLHRTPAARRMKYHAGGFLD